MWDESLSSVFICWVYLFIYWAFPPSNSVSLVFSRSRCVSDGSASAWCCSFWSIGCSVLFMFADTSFPRVLLADEYEAQHISLMSCVCSFNTHLTGWQEFYGSVPHTHLLQDDSDIICYVMYLFMKSHSLKILIAIVLNSFDMLDKISKIRLWPDLITYVTHLSNIFILSIFLFLLLIFKNNYIY